MSGLGFFEQRMQKQIERSNRVSLSSIDRGTVGWMVCWSCSRNVKT